jgi:iron complex outermembrane receptor protein
MVSTASTAICQGQADAAAAAGDTTIEEIVVTSRLREERLQDVPVSVSVFTEKTIRDAGIQRPADFIALTPNMTMASSESVGNVAIVVRGVSEIRNGETPVAVSVDGVLQANSYQFNQDLFDVQQIEVLKGPQGALYGRNAIAGAVNITTKKPTNDFTGRVILGYGNGEQRKIQGGVSGPLVKDKLLFRADASYQQANGWITNTYLNKKVDNYKDEGVSLRLLYMPTDNLNLDLRFHHSATTGGAAYFVKPSNENINPNVHIATAHDVANTVFAPTTNNLGMNDRKLSDISMKIDYSTENGTLTSISNVSWVDMMVTYDGFDYSNNQNCIEFTSPLYTPYACADPRFTITAWGYSQAFNTTFQQTRNKDYSQELRFTSPSKQRFRYIVGAYFLKRDKDLVTATQEDKGFGIIPELDFNPATPNQTRMYFAEQDRDKAYAVFAQGNYDITEQMELGLALRYDADKRDQKDPRPDIYRVDGFGIPISADPHRQKTFSDLEPKVTLNYKPTETQTYYATFAEGFRSGGFNAPGTEIDPFFGQPIADSIYKKETSQNYEVGFKTQFLDRRLTLNGALFYNNAHNLQVFNFNGSVNAQIVTNIDKVRIVGGELEATAVLGQGFTLYGSLGYTDAKIKAYAANLAAVGNQVPYNTKLKTNLGAQYRGQVSDGVNIVARVDWEHRGKTYFHEGGTPIGIPVRDPLNLINARLGVEANGGWALTVWGKNLTNKKYYEEVVVSDYNFQARPRTYGVDLTKSF